MHILHIRHYDVGLCDVPGTRLDSNESNNIGAISAVFPVYACDARESAMATGQR